MVMMRAFIPVMISILLLTGCSPQQPPKVVEPITETMTTHSLEMIAENLEIPWSIEKSGDTFYISERVGNIVKVENGKVVRQNVELEKNLSNAAEAGLLGFVLAPDFLQSKKAFAYYTYDDHFGQFNRIVVLSLEKDVWKEDKVLLDRIPSGLVHHGGRIKIGPDGKLYATTGDALSASISQDLESLGGKILRLNLDGTIPEDNPFPQSYVYSFGHRNPQGITWSPDGTMYASEHGNKANDEINRIKRGENYGWSVIEGSEVMEGMIPPLFTSGEDKTWAPSGIAYLKNKLYVATLRGTAIIEFDLQTGKQAEVISGLGRIRDVFIEGNALYFITNNTDGRGEPRRNDDKLYRLTLE